MYRSELEPHLGVTRLFTFTVAIIYRSALILSHESRGGTPEKRPEPPHPKLPASLPVPRAARRIQEPNSSRPDAAPSPRAKAEEHQAEPPARLPAPGEPRAPAPTPGSPCHGSALPARLREPPHGVAKFRRRLSLFRGFYENK